MTDGPQDDDVERAFRAGHAAGFDCADNTSRAEVNHVEDAWQEYLSTRPVSGEVERLREALTPSASTKAVYIGEFKFDVLVPDIDEDNAELVPMSVAVPWTTIKEIMAAIFARANPQPQEGE